IWPSTSSASSQTGTKRCWRGWARTRRERAACTSSASMASTSARSANSSIARSASAKASTAPPHNRRPALRQVDPDTRVRQPSSSTWRIHLGGARRPIQSERLEMNNEIADSYVGASVVLTNRQRVLVLQEAALEVLLPSPSDRRAEGLRVHN